MRNCVGAAARLSGLGSHTGRPRNRLSNASSSGLKRVMFSILFSCETSNQSAVDGIGCRLTRIWGRYRETPGLRATIFQSVRNGPLRVLLPQLLRSLGYTRKLL